MALDNAGGNSVTLMPRVKTAAAVPKPGSALSAALLANAEGSEGL